MAKSRLAGVASVVLAASAVLTASASATLPEFAGPFEKNFESTSASSTFTTSRGVQIICTSDEFYGKVNEPKEGLGAFSFRGCSSEGAPCQTETFAGPGEILSAVMDLTIGYISPTRREVGVDMVPDAGAPWARFNCGGNTQVVVRGSVIGAITPFDKPVKPHGLFHLRYRQSKGEQRISNFVGDAKDTLEISINGGPFEGVGLTSTERLRFEEETELRS